jgi:Raf kinase inhibitor-like YbhB/YbcL family protein
MSARSDRSPSSPRDRLLFVAVIVATGLAPGALACSNASPSHPGSGAAGSTAGASGSSPGPAGGQGTAGSSQGEAGTQGAAGASGGGGEAGTTGAAGATGGAGTTGAGGANVDGGADASVDKPSTDGPAADGGAMTFTTTSLKMLNGGLVFPAASSAPMNQSPDFSWSGAPAGTLSFAISMYDATLKNTHWILWDIPPSIATLPANLPRGANPTTPAGATQKSAFGGTPGYEGPGGGGTDNYELELWALKVAKLNPGNMSLNQMHTTLLSAQKLGSAQILAKGTRGGL